MATDHAGWPGTLAPAMGSSATSASRTCGLICACVSFRICPPVSFRVLDGDLGAGVFFGFDPDGGGLGASSSGPTGDFGVERC